MLGRADDFFLLIRTELLAGALYPEVKKGTDSFLGIPSQCFALRNSRLMQYQPNDRSAINFRDQYCANLAMKINVKLGGINAAPVHHPAWQDVPFIVFGMHH